MKVWLANVVWQMLIGKHGLANVDWQMWIGKHGLANVNWKTYIGNHGLAPGRGRGVRSVMGFPSFLGLQFEWTYGPPRSRIYC